MKNNSSKQNISVLGCGRWGSFHAWYQAEILKHNVLLWGIKDDPCIVNLQQTRKNNYLELPQSIQLSDDLEQSLNHADHIIIAISAQGMKSFAENIGKHNPKNKTFILCMKGICEDTGERLSGILKAHIDNSNKICVWVGPGHVQDFLSGQPGVMIIASEDKDVAMNIAHKFASDLIKLYVGCDLTGAEIGAAAKNVLGIAAGMLEGARAPTLKGALMARGAYEISKLITAMGGDKMTAYGLSHLGDFEATIFSAHSHNRSYGVELMRSLGEGRDPQGIGLAEGISTSKSLMILAKKHNVDMPICTLVYQILHEGKSPKDGFKEIFLRSHSEEFRY